MTEKPCGLLLGGLLGPKELGGTMPHQVADSSYGAKLQSICDDKLTETTSPAGVTIE